MFLVKLHNMYYKKSTRIQRVIEKQNFKSPTNNYEPLVAPPLIDQIWTILISMGTTYDKFCNENFGFYLHRDDPFRLNNNPDLNYEATLNLLNEYRDLTNPMDSIWMNLSKEEYTFEMINFVFLEKKRTSEIRFKNIKPNFTQAGDWKNNANILRDQLKIKPIHPFTPIHNFTHFDIIKRNGKSSSIKNLYKNIKRHFKPCEERILNRFVLKYIITKNLASMWLEEFHKYLIVMLHLGLDNGSFIPSPVLGRVWKTYTEFTKVYGGIMSDLFGDYLV
mmetsp:Transcript_26967/g.23811  ORF Transcript_26967/g.23811 Transcript_26967/m.23811 type:complete len:277 (+) Transcript_26967:356-1186(+)